MARPATNENYQALVKEVHFCATGSTFKITSTAIAAALTGSTAITR